MRETPRLLGAISVGAVALDHSVGLKLGVRYFVVSIKWITLCSQARRKYTATDIANNGKFENPKDLSVDE